jgi:S1-C subfamily serine protease
MKRRIIQSSKGIIISYIDEKGGAAEAGLKGMTQDQYGRIYIGDVILSVDDQPVNNLDDIYQVIDKKKIGDLVDIIYRRDGKTLSAKIKLKAL